MHKEEEVEQGNSDKPRKEKENESREVVMADSMCSITCGKTPSTTPYSPLQDIRTHDNPFATPTHNPNPPHSPHTTPTTPSFHTFLQHEIATLRNTTPLHTLLNMNSFWSPHAPLTPYTPIKHEINPPVTPTPGRTPPTALLSPWGEGVKVVYSPSLFVVKAAMMSDGDALSRL